MGDGGRLLGDGRLSGDVMLEGVGVSLDIGNVTKGCQEKKASFVDDLYMRQRLGPWH